MANMVARSFLSDKSFDALESSEGAKNIARQFRIGVLKFKINRNKFNIESTFEKFISENLKRIESLRAGNFITRKINARKNAPEIQRLEAENEDAREKQRKAKEEIEVSQIELDRLEKEFAQFLAIINGLGLTMEDIEEEYNLIKEELAEKAKRVEDKSTTALPERPKRMTQTEKFNARLAKRDEILAKQKS